MSKATELGKTPCACGKGIRSEHDHKCGHCRTKKEQSLFRKQMHELYSLKPKYVKLREAKHQNSQLSGWGSFT